MLEKCDERLKNLHGKIHEIKSSVQTGVKYMKMEERDRLIREEGEEHLRKLVQFLIKEKKYEELERVAEDGAYRKELYKKYNI